MEKNKANLVFAKWKRSLILVLLTVVVIAFFTREKEITHITANDGVTQIKIPYEIVKSKDCNKYHEWFYSHMTPLSFLSDRCPWAKPPKSPIGEFVVNGEKFWVPRQYLWQDHLEPDGHVHSLHLMMIYPDMRPATGKPEERDMEVMVTIYSTYRSDDCRLHKQCDAEQYHYIHYSNFDRLSEEEKKVYPIDMGYKTELDLTEYHFKLRVKDFYVRGDKYKPTYWLMCDGGTRKENWNPGCESHFNWSDKLYVEYVFRQTDLLPHHDEVRQKVIKKITEFQQNTGVDK
jgi:hypothetical protein